MKNRYKNMRISYFKKLFIYSLFIITIIIVIGNIFNMFLFDKFYIARKKTLIMKVVEDVNRISKLQIEKNEKREILEDYKDKVKEFDGIEFKLISNKRYYSQKYGKRGHGKNRRITHERIKFENQEFILTNIGKSNIKMLSYTLKIENEMFITAWTSISVMQGHKEELLIFNLLSSIVGILITVIIAHSFSKKLTRDMERLSITAKSISKLEFPKNIKIERGDEIGDLSIELEKMSNKLYEGIENLKSFVSNASHELKTPISVINSYSQTLLLENSISKEKEKKYYETIFKESINMEELVQNLLTISKIDSSSYVLTKENIEIKSLISDSLEKYENLELKKDLTIETNLEKENFYGNLSLMKIVVDNIIENSMKYAKETGVLEIYQLDKKIYFSNEISKSIDVNIDKIWDSFYRGEEQLEKEVSGHGLGLAIVKKILELHDIGYGIDIKEEKFIFWIKINQ